MATADWIPHTTTAEMVANTKGRNLLNGKPLSEVHGHIMTQRQNLPVFKNHQAFLDQFQRHQVLLFVGATGSGKSTQIPQFALFDCVPDRMRVRARKGKKIACTQPRRLAAEMVAKRVAAELDVELGEEVGYVHGGGSRTGPKTLIEFSTDGSLLSKAIKDPLLSEFCCIIIDEAHERTADTEMLMAILKLTVTVRPELKVVIMSATLDSDKFQQFYPGSHIMEVAGTAFPVEIYYAENANPNPLTAAAEIVMDIHLYEPAGDILVFASGALEIKKIIDAINAMLKKREGQGVAELLVVPLMSNTDKDGQALAFGSMKIDGTPPKIGLCRKVVVATNVAETSLTIDGIVYIVDTLLVKQKVYDPITRCLLFGEVPISWAQARQRAGRAGRTQPGKCYRVCSQHTYDTKLTPQPVPTILSQSMTSVVLKVLAIAPKTDCLPFQFPFLQAPSPAALARALEELDHLGFYDAGSESLTTAGQIAAALRLEPPLAAVLIRSCDDDFACSSEVACIIAMIQALDGKSLYRKDANDETVDFSVDHYNKAWPGGHVRYLHIYLDWRLLPENAKYKFCDENAFDMRVLREADRIRIRLVRLMKKVNLPILELPFDKNYNYYHTITKVFCMGYFMQAARLQNSSYYTLKEQTRATAADSFLRVPSCGTAHKEWIIYHECMFISGKTVLQEPISIIKPQWLLQARPSYFQLEKFPISDSTEALSKAKKHMKRQVQK